MQMTLFKPPLKGPIAVPFWYVVGDGGFWCCPYCVEWHKRNFGLHISLKWSREANDYKTGQCSHCSYEWPFKYSDGCIRFNVPEKVDVQSCARCYGCNWVIGLEEEPPYPFVCDKCMRESDAP